MKLYYSSGACSMAPHIVANELGMHLDMEKVDIPNKKTETGADFWAVNVKGYVPTLKLDDGAVLTEVGVIVQNLADQKPDSGLTRRPAPWSATGRWRRSISLPPKSTSSLARCSTRR